MSFNYLTGGRQPHKEPGNNIASTAKAVRCQGFRNRSVSDPLASQLERKTVVQALAMAVSYQKHLLQKEEQETTCTKAGTT